MFCPKCGTENQEGTVFCGKCGNSLKGISPTGAVKSSSGDPGIQTLIPYKNAMALIAYYMGVFSIIPCFPIGIIGLVLGIMGLRYVKKHPEAKGKVHAWIGIIIGGFFGIIYLVFTVMMLFSIGFK